MSDETPRRPRHPGKGKFPMLKLPPKWVTMMVSGRIALGVSYLVTAHQ